MPDSNGNPYASVASTNVGSQLCSGRDITPYLPLGTVVTVVMAPGRNAMSPRLAVQGVNPDIAGPAMTAERDLAGQLDRDGFYHGGLSPNGQEYVGWYAGASLPANPGWGVQAAYGTPGAPVWQG